MSRLRLLLMAPAPAAARAFGAPRNAGAAPVPSDTIASLLPVPLSSASVRNTLAELAELGLVEKAHRSAGRRPTGWGLRTFVGQLLAVRELGPFELAGEAAVSFDRLAAPRGKARAGERECERGEGTTTTQRRGAEHGCAPPTAWKGGRGSLTLTIG